LFEKSKYSPQGKIGALIFDDANEVLVCTAESNGRIGLAELSSSDVENFESLTSNILQFFFKSIFQTSVSQLDLYL